MNSPLIYDANTPLGVLRIAPPVPAPPSVTPEVERLIQDEIARQLDGAGCPVQDDYQAAMRRRSAELFRGDR